MGRRKSIEERIGELGSEDWQARRRALKGLARLGDEAGPAVPEIAELLTDPHWKVRRWAARCLAYVGSASSQVLPQLLDALDDETKTVRNDTCLALASMGELAAPAVDRLGQGLRDGGLDPTSAAQALGNIGAASMPLVPELRELAKSGNEAQRYVASGAMTHILRMANVRREQEGVGAEDLPLADPALAGLRVVERERSVQWVFAILCSNCQHLVEGWRSSAMSEAYPHFYCDRCSNAILRGSDGHAIRAGPSEELLAQIAATLPDCHCGGRFRPGTNPKCPACGFEFEHQSDPLTRLTDPHIIVLDGASVYDDDGPSYRNRVVGSPLSG